MRGSTLGAQVELRSYVFLSLTSQALGENWFRGEVALVRVKSPTQSRALPQPDVISMTLLMLGSWTITLISEKFSASAKHLWQERRCMLCFWVSISRNSTIDVLRTLALYYKRHG